MRKVIPFLVVVIAFAFVAGCGPKGASQEQLAALAQGKSAVEAAEAKAKEIDDQITALEAEKAEKQETLKGLQEEFENLEKTLTQKKEGTEGEQGRWK